MRIRSAAVASVGVLVLYGCGQVPVASPEPDRSTATGSTTPTAPTAPAEPSPTATPAAPADFARTLDRVESGVVMVRATTCSGTGVGSGFLVGGDQIITAAHVVDGAVSVAVAQGDLVQPATVLGVDEERDVAVLSTAGIPGFAFSMTPTMPAAGTAVAVVGHPLGEPLTITSGNVSRIDDALWPNLQLDVSVSPGNSGGPVVTADGRVVGVLVGEDREADGLAYALRSDAVAPLVQGAEALSPPVRPACSTPLGPDDGELPSAPASDPLTQAAAQTFIRYFGGINSGDYRTAYNQLAPRLRSGYEPFAEGVSTSYDFDFDVRSVTPLATGAAVWLRFVSLQEASYGPDGEGCTQWSLDYELAWNPAGSRLLIHRVEGHNGTEGHRPCS
jgi:serine protease Do